MNLLSRTIPFALVAAFFPAGLGVVLWLLSLPHGRTRALVYFAGAATCTIGSGVAILTVVGEAGSVRDQHPGAVASVRIAVGLILLGFGLFLLVRPPSGQDSFAVRLRRQGRRPRYWWVFLLGVVMWTPSFAYLAALGFIADADLGWIARWAQLVVIDAVILVMIEVPLLVEAFAPGWANRQLRGLSTLVAKWAREVGMVTAGGGGLYLVITGIRDLL